MTTLEFSNLSPMQQKCLTSAPVNGDTPLFIERIKTTIETNNLACMVGMPLELSTSILKLKKWDN